MRRELAQEHRALLSAGLQVAPDFVLLSAEQAAAHDL
jgi:hypothetical protein